MSDVIYFDTSALAKWYVNEPASDEVEKYIHEHGPVAISDLTVVEMRSLLARHRREKHIGLALEIEIFATFQEDIRQKFLICHPLPNELAIAAVNLLAQLPNVPLSTLDALHLALAREIRTNILATSDRVMAAAARDLGLHLVRF